MKKNVLWLCLLGILVLALVGCKPNEPKNEVAFSPEKPLTVKIGASPVPHAEILKEIVPALAEKGIKLEIVEFTDYVLPNIGLEDGSLDANFF